MKKFYFIIAILLVGLMQSCSTYTVTTFQPDQNNGSDCPNPIYIGTMAKSSFTPSITSEGAYNQKSLTLYQLLLDARKKYGEDVTIHNVRWDVNGKEKVSVIYDVIKCK